MVRSIRKRILPGAAAMGWMRLWSARSSRSSSRSPPSGRRPGDGRRPAPGRSRHRTPRGAQERTLALGAAGRGSRRRRPRACAGASGASRGPGPGQRQPGREPVADDASAGGAPRVPRRARCRAAARRAACRSRATTGSSVPAPSRAGPLARVPRTGRTASSPRGRTGTSCSPATWSGARLVTMTRLAGDARTMSATVRGASSRCSRLSSTRTIERSARRERARRRPTAPGRRAGPSRWATAARTCGRVGRPRRVGTNHAPSG